MLDVSAHILGRELFLPALPHCHTPPIGSHFPTPLSAPHTCGVQEEHYGLGGAIGAVHDSQRYPGLSGVRPLHTHLQVLHHQLWWNKGEGGGMKGREGGGEEDIVLY